MKMITALILCCLSLPLFAAQRIVAIGGDITQIIYALNAQSRLVGRDTTSTSPAAVAAVPDVGYLRQLNAEGILSLKPDLVIASALAKPSAALEQVARAGVKVVTITGETTPAAITAKVLATGNALNKDAEARSLAARLDQQLKALPTRPLPVKVLYIMAHSGMNTMAAGTQTAADNAIHSVGLVNAMGNIPHYQTLSQEGVVAAAPDMVVIGSTSLATLGGSDALWRLPGLALTPAGQAHQLLVVDEMALLSFGPDTPQALAGLRKAAETVRHDSATH